MAYGILNGTSVQCDTGSAEIFALPPGNVCGRVKVAV